MVHQTANIQSTNTISISQNQKTPEMHPNHEMPPAEVDPIFQCTSMIFSNSSKYAQPQDSNSTPANNTEKPRHDFADCHEQSPCSTKILHTAV